MATQTTHYNLIKPSSADRVAVGDLNDNADTIDGYLYIANERADQISQDYNPSSTYNTGDYVRRENYIYKCKQDNVTGTWDATKWDRVYITDELGQGSGGSSTLAGLNDVSLSSPTNGQLLGYNSVTQKWENVNGGGGGSSTLAGLSDVSVSGVANKDIIRYNSTSQKYEKSSDLTDLELSVSQLSSSVLSIAGDVDTLELTVSQMSASTLPYDANTSTKQKIDNVESSIPTSASDLPYSSTQSTKQKIDEVNADVTSLENEILKDAEFFNVANSSDGVTYTLTFSEIAANTRFPFIVLKAHQVNVPSNPIVWCCINNAGTPMFLTSDSTSVQFNFATKTISVGNGANSWAQPIIIAPKGLLKV